MKKIVLLSLCTSAVLMAGGYKIPEASLNAVALGAANVAHSHGADAAYYNPANMIFMKDENIVESDLMYIGLSKIKYEGYTASTGTLYNNIESKKEDFIVPSLHYVSPDIDGARFGLSIVSPAGLSKRWNNQPALSSAQEFTLTTVEINPSIALPIGDKVAIAVGIRAIYSEGIVKAYYPGGVVSQDMEGDSIDFGYNLALSYKPSKELSFGLTYRSKVDLKMEGDADLFHYSYVNPKRNYSTAVEIPVPALLNLAVAYTFPTNTTVEFVFEKNYWSAYSTLDFNYSDPYAEAVFGRASSKNWKDTSVYRFGITQELDKLTLMGGIVLDETPIPDESLGFELPDSDSLSVSFGARYQMTEKINVGLAALYSMRDDRRTNDNNLNGEFKDSNVLIISAGLEYRF